MKCLQHVKTFQKSSFFTNISTQKYQYQSTSSRTTKVVKDDSCDNWYSTNQSRKIPNDKCLKSKETSYWLCSFAMYWWYLLEQGILLGLMAFKNPECLINKFPIDEDDPWANSVRWMSDTLVLKSSRCFSNGYSVLKVNIWTSFTNFLSIQINLFDQM